ncbi:AAA family ATPase [Anaerolineales bacterium HSG6]|nr:AAA family ATPase [Anaerolineales bacterium HSG6]
MSIVISGYDIKEMLYQGERTTVYRGIREADDKSVILKMLRQEYPPPRRIAWFKREYGLLTKQSEIEGVIDVYEFLTYRNRLVMTMEDFGGQSLTKLMKLRPIRMTEFLPMAIKMVEVLGQIHQQQIIHKDVNPSNIIYNANTEQIKIIDFGISSDLSQEKTVMQAAKGLKGTLAYISPEQTGRMNRMIDYRTDFYSLGATFYEMLTGELPFSTNDTMELIHAHIAQQPVPPHEQKHNIPETLSEIILKLMSKNAIDRYQSTFGIKADLEECLQQWQATGRIDPFPIAQSDISSRFQVSQKLYGRAKEIDILLTAFDRASIGSSEMMLVAGYSGIGKTVLVQEVHKPITRQRGYFISGKFDQLQRDIPYASLTQAFQSLVRQLLAEDEAEITVWKEKLLATLGESGQVIVDVIPNLEQLIGPQPAVPELGPMESQNRFNLFFQNFIQLFAQPEHPLVIFLDDLQWADTASLKLLNLLMTTDSQNLFVIGAYRDNEVDAAHPLILGLEEIEKAGGIVNTITLGPLLLPTVKQLVADTVVSTPDRAEPLAKLVYTKTHGNPFFINEFLKEMHDEKLLTFDYQAGKWDWDLGQIENRDITDNVIELMASKVRKLPDETQQVLKLAACIGNRFDIQTLAVVNQKSVPETATALYTVLVEGLVLPLDENYNVINLDVEGLTDELISEHRFAHDRIQQAVYSLIPDEDKQTIHQEIGQLMLANMSEEELKQKIFDVVNQLNQGQSLLESQEEQDKLAELNLQAGKKAKASAAFKLAYLYLQIGVDLVGQDGWQRCYGLILELHEEAAETAYLSGDFDAMEQLAETVLKKAKDKMDKVRVYQIKIQAEIAKNQPVVGINTSREALALFGVDIPAKPTPEQSNEALAKTKARWEKRGIDDLIDLPRMSDPEKLAVVRILQKLYFVSFVVDYLQYQIVVSQMISLSIDYGNDPVSSPDGYSQYASVLCALGDIENGYKSGKLAEELIQNFGQEAITSAATVGCIFNGTVRIWVEHLDETRQPLLEAYRIGMDTGNFMFATLSIAFYTNNLYFLGLELTGVEREIAKYNQLLHDLNQWMFIDILDMYQQSILNLTGKAATETPHLLVGKVYNEGDETDGRRKTHLDTNNSYSLAHLYLNKVILSYLFDKNKAAFDYSNEGQNYIGNMQSQSSVPIFNFYDSLAKLAVYQDSSEDEQEAILAHVTTNQEQMKMWADHAPANYQGKYELVKAELARISGDDGQARELYDNAVTLTMEHGYLNDEALANELAAKFYLSINRRHVARHYLRDAVYAYLRWGAIAKVQHLEKKYADLLGQMTMTSTIQGTTTTFTTTATRTGEHAFGALDFMSILKASQSLSGEIVLDTVLSNVMKTVLENAGAEKGYIILDRGGQLVIEVEGQAGQEMKVLQSIPVETSLPVSIINYVKNSLESVVLSDATTEGGFAKDDYIINQKPKSVLCTPLVNQGKLQGILYLENNLTTGAFTPGRIQVLHLLSTQAAISIENASLYGQQVELTESYSRFVPIEYLKFLQKKQIMDVELGDHVAKEMAIMFSDIREFTTISEAMTPQENFNFVNSYLKRVSPKIRDNDGFIVKFLGDGMMAVFPNGADDCLKAGIQKLEQVELYNRYRVEKGRRPIAVGVGIHVGHMMVGMIGEENRMQGDAFSDNVNLTARIEGLTKFYGVSFVISDETYNNLDDPHRYQIRFLDRVIVKGRTKPISIYEVLDGLPEKDMNLKLETQADFEKGMRRYQAKEFDDAKHHFNEVLRVNPNDSVATLYINRIADLVKHGVPSDWDGVTVMTMK